MTLTGDIKKRLVMFQRVVRSGGSGSSAWDLIAGPLTSFLQ